VESLTNYRGIIARVLEEYRELYAPTELEGVDLTVIQDDAHGEYMLMRVGWRGEKRVDKPVFYLRLKNDKIYIEEDWTEEGVVMDLTRAGVPHHDIVLAFNPPFVRHLTEYAVS
jgi:hypothetical protein